MSDNHFSTASLEDLCKACLDELAQYRRKAAPSNETRSCLEILRRAAAQDPIAIGVLLLRISYPLVAAYCSDDLKAWVEDVQQEVALRLLRKFMNREQPYRVTSFPAYLKYLKLTVRSVICNLQEQNRTAESLEESAEDQDAGPMSDVANPDRAALARRLLAALPDPLQRECLERRYLLGQSPAEIAADLQPLYPEVTKAQVYRWVQRGLSKLRKTLAVSALSEPEAG